MFYMQTELLIMKVKIAILRARLFTVRNLNMFSRSQTGEKILKNKLIYKIFFKLNRLLVGSAIRHKLEQLHNASFRF